MCLDRLGDEAVAICPQDVVFGALGRNAASSRCVSMAGRRPAVCCRDRAGHNHIPYQQFVIKDEEGVSLALGQRRGSALVGGALGMSGGWGESGGWVVGAVRGLDGCVGLQAGSVVPNWVRNGAQRGGAGGGNV
jgi:hypothetical protein